MREPAIINGDIWPCTIMKTRYDGIYEGAPYVALARVPGDIDHMATGPDPECSGWWSEVEGPVGQGNTPQQAYDDLKAKLKRDG